MIRVLGGRNSATVESQLIQTVPRAVACRCDEGYADTVVVGGLNVLSYGPNELRMRGLPSRDSTLHMSHPNRWIRKPPYLG